MAKATFIIYKDENCTGNKEEIPVLFNPAQYVIRKSAQYESTSNVSTGKENSVPSDQKNYKGPKDQTLSVELFFDTTENRILSLEPVSNTGERVEDVSVYTNQFLKLTEVREVSSGENKEMKPPLVGFKWGSTTFIGHVENVDVTYTMFTPDGKPVRAKINLSITKAAVGQASNPPKTAVGSNNNNEDNKETTYQIQNFADLCKLASQFSTTFQKLCKDNHISDPLGITAGTQIQVKN